MEQEFWDNQFFGANARPFGANKYFDVIANNRISLGHFAADPDD